MVPDGSDVATTSAGQLQLGFDQLNTDAQTEFYDVFAIQNQGEQNIGLFLDDGNASAAASAEESLEGDIEVKLENEGISFGIFDDGQNGAGQPNGAVALPSKYRAGSLSFDASSNPYVLAPGDVFRPDMYFVTGDDDAGVNVSGTLRVLGFTDEWVSGPTPKGP
jgi:hypothetical protein